MQTLTSQQHYCTSNTLMEHHGCTRNKNDNFQSNTHTSFFKILLDDSNPNLPLPPAFVKKQFVDDKFLQNPVLETEFGGKWKVEIEKIGGKVCFGNGWLQFVKDTKTEVGDFLVFRLIGKSTFKVSVFGPHACAKDLRFATPTNYKCSCNCSRSGNSNDSLNNEIKIDDDDDVDDEIKIEEDDDIDEDEGRDEVKNDYDFNEEEEEIDEDDTESENDEDEYDEEEDEVKVIKVEPFDWEEEESFNPSFEKVLTKSFKHEMSLPKRFVKEAGLDNQEKIELRNKEMKKWSVRIGRRTSGDYHLANGWKSFWKENKLKEGDTCSFKYFPGGNGRESFIAFDVVKSVTRKRGRPRLDKSVSYQFVGEVVKQVGRKRGRPRKGETRQIN